MRSSQHAPAEVVVAVTHAGEREEEAASLGLDVLLERLTVEALLHRDEPRSRLRWNDTNASPWSSRPASSKPREKLKPRRRIRLSSVAFVRGFARRMCASSGVMTPSASSAKSGISVSRLPPSGAPDSLCRPMIASCSASGVRSQNSTNMRMARTAT